MWILPAGVRARAIVGARGYRQLVTDKSDISLFISGALIKIPPAYISISPLLRFSLSLVPEGFIISSISETISITIKTIFNPLTRYIFECLEGNMRKSEMINFYIYDYVW